MRKLSLCVFVFLMAFTQVAGQDEFREQYFNGKNLFLEGQYNLAMEAFKKAIPYDRNNPFSEYASFYYSVAAYRQGYLSVAKDMFMQLQKLHPGWDKMDEVNFWLGKIHMDNKEYFQGLNVWKDIKSPALKKDVLAHEKQYLFEITDPETLRMMSEDYPEDPVIGAALARALAADLSDPMNRDQFEQVVRKYKLDRSDFLNEAPPTYFKDRYSVSVMYPFMLSTLDYGPGRKRNQLILDLYEGMKLAVDTLNSMGVKIDLRAYDTERKTTTIKRILETEELKNTDLIVGPFFAEENALVQEFSTINRVNVFKAFTGNLEMIGVNEFGFLIQPSYETIGGKSARFMGEFATRNKNLIVIYGPTKKDSLMAASFVKQANEEGLKIIASKKIERDESASIVRYLATPTEYDEWRKPTEFELKKDSIAGIYVASDDALIYSKVVSSIETRGDSILVVGAESWLEQTAVDYEKFQSLGIVLPAPNFYDPNKSHYQAFVRRYIRQNGQAPSEYAKLGYETMMFLGNSLHKNGVYFQQAFEKDKVFPGYLSQGFSYPFSHDNQLIPFVRFVNGSVKVVKIY